MQIQSNQYPAKIQLENLQNGPERQRVKYAEIDYGYQIEYQTSESQHHDHHPFEIAFIAKSRSVT